MFDVGFGEMIVIALIALIVLGPERLPKLARWIGRFTGQARAYMQGLSAELERESHLADLKRQLAETERLAREHADTINRAVMSTGQEASAALPAPVMTALPAPALASPPATIAVPEEVGLVNAVPVPTPTPTPIGEAHGLATTVEPVATHTDAATSAGPGPGAAP